MAKKASKGKNGKGRRKEPPVAVGAIPPRIARAHFDKVSKGPKQDRGRQARVVAPAVATTEEERRLQHRWMRQPNRMDYEGVDTNKTPEGPVKPTVAKAAEPKVATPKLPKPAKAKPAARSVAPGRPRPAALPGADVLGALLEGAIDQDQLDAAGVDALRESVVETLTRGGRTDRGQGERAADYIMSVMQIRAREGKMGVEAAQRATADEAGRRSDGNEGEGPRRDAWEPARAEAELPAGMPPKGVPADAEGRRTRGESEPDGGEREGYDGSPGRAGDVRGRSEEHGDQGVDTGFRDVEELSRQEAAGELEKVAAAEDAQVVSSAAATSIRGHDAVLSAEQLDRLRSPTARFDANLEAIRTLRRIENEGREPTPEEREALSLYSGFGDSAFNPAFDRYVDADWRARSDELKTLLTPEEYRKVGRSRLNAFYTTPEVISAMWRGLERLGAGDLGKMRVLEPAAGSGRFLGLQPTEMAERSARVAVELDAVTGAVLSKAYPQTQVYAQGFEAAPVPDGSVDIAISNVPFGSYGVSDPAYIRSGRKWQTRKIHNYFFAKAIDKLRPGGVLAFVTSHFTMDAKDSRFREALAKEGDLLFAVRLPKGAFPDTDVVTDIVFMRKKDPANPIAEGPEWVGAQTVQLEDGYGRQMPATVNRYFVDHPQMVLGEPALARGMYGPHEYTVRKKDDGDLQADLNEAIRKATPANVMTLPANRRDSAPESRVLSNSEFPAGEQIARLNPGALLITASGEIRQLRDDELRPTSFNAAEKARVKALLGVRDKARRVLQLELEDGLPPEDIAEARGELNKAYDAFVKKHGPINDKANARLLQGDPDAGFLRALEQCEDCTEEEKRKGKGAWSKMPIFRERIVRGVSPTAVTADEALAAILNVAGKVDFEEMAALLGRTPESVREELAESGRIFRDPVAGWQTAGEYLTGSVREKLRAAEAAAHYDPSLSANIEALRGVIPQDLGPGEITAELGAPWVPQEYVNQFITDLLRLPAYHARARFYDYNADLGKWMPRQKVYGQRAMLSNVWGTQDAGADKLIDRLLQNKTIEVTRPDPDSPNRRIRDQVATAAAQAKAREIRAEFQRWLWDDPERAERLAGIYNETFNAYLPRRYDGAHLTLPGMVNSWVDKLHEHQRDAIWRIVEDGSALLAHEVGFGKTAVMAGAGMELRRLGLAKKNMYVVPKATHNQFRNQFQEIYPGARILFPTEEDFKRETRPEFMSRIATGDWDAVIVSDTQFRSLPMSPETRKRMLDEELNKHKLALEELAEEEGRGANRRTQKQIENAIAKLEKQIKDVQKEIDATTDRAISFEDLGIDQLFVDEADNYKNLQFATAMERIKGLPNSQSKRAFDMYSKTRYLQGRNKGRGVVFATGTPVANTIAELWTMMRYLQPGMLAEKGLTHFDSWARTFGETTTSLEQTVTGAFRYTERFAKFNNLPELSRLWQGVSDIRVIDEVPAMASLRPMAKRETLVAPATPELTEYMGGLAARARRLADVSPKVDNMLKISSDARKASLDLRMVNPDAADNPKGKVAMAAQQVAKVWKETAPEKGTQLVFLDIGTPKAVKDGATKGEMEEEEGVQAQDEVLLASEAALLTDVYRSLRTRLEAQGIPREEIAFIHDAKTDAQREALFAKVNEGQVRVLVGSTGKLGVGVNVQKRAAALHHLDAPWRPRDIEQREGRVIRQGNKVYGPAVNPETGEREQQEGVRIYNYVTEGSFDAYMWQAIESKAKAIKSLLRRDVTARTISDADDLVLTAAEVKALASGNPLIMEKVKLEHRIRDLQLLEAGHRRQLADARSSVRSLPGRIESLHTAIAGLEVDERLAESGAATLQVGGKRYEDDKDDRRAGGKALREALARTPRFAPPESAPVIGEYRGFAVSVEGDDRGYILRVENASTGIVHKVKGAIAYEDQSPDVLRRLDNALETLPAAVERAKANLASAQRDLETYRKQANEPFEKGEELAREMDRLKNLERELRGVGVGVEDEGG